MDDAEHGVGFVNHIDGGDLAFLHEIEGFAGQDMRMDGLWVTRHAEGEIHLESCAAVFFHETAEVTVSEDSGEAAVGFEDGGHAETFAAHFVNHFNDGSVERDVRESIAGVHFVFDAEKLLAKIPKHGFTLVVESGIKSSSELPLLKQLGAHAVLIGETFMRADDPEQLVKEFVLACQK